MRNPALIGKTRAVDGFSSTQISVALVVARLLFECTVHFDRKTQGAWADNLELAIAMR